MILFADTSALAKRYLAEPGSAWMRTMTDPGSGNTVVIGNITRVELGAAVARRQRDPRHRMTTGERDGLIRLFDYHVAHEYLVVDVTPTVIDAAYHLTQRHQLRGYDAVQLAAALALHAQLATAGLRQLILVSSDSELLTAGGAEGLVTQDPTDYP